MNEACSPSSSATRADPVTCWVAPIAAATESCAACRTGAGSTANALDPMRSAYSEVKMLPSTATPSVPPASRVASLTAEPTPAFAAGSTLRIDSVAGAVVRPSPRPMSTICPTICPYAMNVGDSAIQPNELPSSNSPLLTTARVPSRPASATPATEPIAMVVATGRMRRPVDSVP